LSISARFSSRFWYFSIIGILVALVVTLTFANYRFAERNPGGHDFRMHYLSTRAFVMEEISPYSPATSREIQLNIYGRPVHAGEDLYRVDYPFYAEILYVPFALVENYILARALWMTFLEISLVAIAILSMQVTKWRPGLWLIPVYFLFSLFWYHGFLPLINGNSIIVVTLLMITAILAIRDQHDIVAGILLACTTIQPLVSLMLILFVLLWGISQRRWALIGWLFGWLLILILLGMLFIPDWVLQNFWSILRQPNLTPPLSAGATFEIWWPGIGTQLRWGTTLFLVGITLFEWWTSWGKGFERFLWTACLTLVVSQWIGIAADPENYIVLFLPVVIVFSIIKERWGKIGDWLALASMLLVFLGLWAIFLNNSEYRNQIQPDLIMLVPLPIFVLSGLYWARWWILRPTRRIIEQ